MTTVTRTKLVCQCGHQGMIVMRENDAPFSRQYESYSLENLNGQSFSVQDRFAQWDVREGKIKVNQIANHPGAAQSCGKNECPAAQQDMGFDGNRSGTEI